MGRVKYYKKDYGTYAKCYLCDYEIKNNKRTMKLHFRYSHPEKEFTNEKKDRNRCNVCKKERCWQH